MRERERWYARRRPREEERERRRREPTNQRTLRQRRRGRATRRRRRRKRAACSTGALELAVCSRNTPELRRTLRPHCSTANHQRAAPPPIKGAPRNEECLLPFCPSSPPTSPSLSPAPFAPCCVVAVRAVCALVSDSCVPVSYRYYSHHPLYVIVDHGFCSCSSGRLVRRQPHHLTTQPVPRVPR